MKRFILIGLAVAAIGYLFIAVFVTTFNGMQETTAAVVAAALFLAFELVVCTGLILSRLDRAQKEKSAGKKE